MKGVDVNNGRGVIDWRRVRAAGYEFAWIKATEGRTWDDSRFTFNMRAAKAAGLRVGAYHFARPDNNTAQAEVEHFARVYRPQPGELLPVLDFEVEPASATWALDFLRRLEAAIGARPVLYTYAAFLTQMGSFEALGRYPLWYAHYGLNDGNEHPAQPPSQFHFAAHQFSSRGRVPGIPGTTDNPFADVNRLKLPSLDTILYRPGGGEPWRGKFELYAGGTLVSVGNIRTEQLTLTEEAKRWVEAVRAAGGQGRVAPASTAPAPGDAPGGEDGPPDVETQPSEGAADPEAEPSDAEADVPEYEEGDGSAGQWAQHGDLEDRQREDFD